MHSQGFYSIAVACWHVCGVWAKWCPSRRKDCVLPMGGPPPLPPPCRGAGRVRGAAPVKKRKKNNLFVWWGKLEGGDSVSPLDARRRRRQIISGNQCHSHVEAPPRGHGFGHVCGVCVCVCRESLKTSSHLGPSSGVASVEGVGGGGGGFLGLGELFV